MEDLRKVEFKKSYVRMLQQEKFIQEVVKVSEEELLGLDLGRELDEKYGRVEDSDIEEMAEKYAYDESWLSENLCIIENRFAYAVKRVIETDEGQMINLKEHFYELGQEVEPDYEGLPIKDVYTFIRNLLLDGGKSEELNQIISEDFDEIVWSRITPTTIKYWDEMGIDFHTYYLPLRQSFIFGLTEKTDVEFKKLDDTVCVLSRR